MKKLFFLASTLLLSLCAHAQDTPKTLDDLTFNKQLVADQRVFEFGDIKEQDGKVSHVFRLKNTGTAPIVIAEAHAFCGCTTPEYSKEPILPGKEGKLTVTFNPYGRPGKFSKEVIVLLGNGREYMQVWVKGNVIPFDHPITEDHPYHLGEGLYSSMKVFPFPPRKVGEEYVFHWKLANSTDKQMVVELSKEPNNTVLKVPARIVLKPGERTEVLVSYRQPRIHKYNCHILLCPKVNGKRIKPLRVSWIGEQTMSK